MTRPLWRGWHSSSRGLEPGFPKHPSLPGHPHWGTGPKTGRAPQKEAPTPPSPADTQSWGPICSYVEIRVQPPQTVPHYKEYWTTMWSTYNEKVSLGKELRWCICTSPHCQTIRARQNLLRLGQALIADCFLHANSENLELAFCMEKILESFWIYKRVSQTIFKHAWAPAVHQILLSAPGTQLLTRA